MVIPWGTLLRIVVFYYRVTTKCDIIPQCVTFGVVFPMDYSTTIDIVPQSVAFLLQSVVFPMNYPKSNCSISLQNIIVYHKNI